MYLIRAGNEPAVGTVDEISVPPTNKAATELNPGPFALTSTWSMRVLRHWGSLETEENRLMHVAPYGCGSENGIQNDPLASKD